MAFSSQVLKVLSKVSIFQEMGPAELEELALMCVRKKIPANSKVEFTEAEEDSFCVLNDGKIIVKSIETKKIVKYLESSDFFGEISMFDSKPYPVEFFSEENEAELLLFTKKDFTDLLQNHPTIHLALSRELCWRLRATKNESAYTSISSKIRLGSALLRLSKGKGVTKTADGILLPKITQDELSKLADVSKESIQEVFLELRKCELIMPTDTKQILVTNIANLEAWTTRHMAKV